jgi:hypothetical protein
MAEIRNHAISLPFVHRIFVLLKRAASGQRQIAGKKLRSVEPDWIGPPRDGVGN